MYMSHLRPFINVLYLFKIHVRIGAIQAMLTGCLTFFALHDMLYVASLLCVHDMLSVACIAWHALRSMHDLGLGFKVPGLILCSC